MRYRMLSTGGRPLTVATHSFRCVSSHGPLWTTADASQSVELICKCETPANPDKTLIGCTNSQCGKWMYHDCLMHDALLRVYERLGTDQPHKIEQPIKKEKDEEIAARPLSPNEAGEADTQPTIDVRAGDMQDNVLVKRVDEETPRLTHTPTPTPQTSVLELQPKSSGKKTRKRKGMDYRPYEGLFTATLKMNDGPTVWVIEDLRENIPGGEKTWTEQAHCVLCGVVID